MDERNHKLDCFYDFMFKNLNHYRLVLISGRSKIYKPEFVENISRDLRRRSINTVIFSDYRHLNMFLRTEKGLYFEAPLDQTQIVLDKINDFKLLELHITYDIETNLALTEEKAKIGIRRSLNSLIDFIKNTQNQHNLKIIIDDIYYLVKYFPDTLITLIKLNQLYNFTLILACKTPEVISDFKAAIKPFFELSRIVADFDSRCLKTNLFKDHNEILEKKEFITTNIPENKDFTVISDELIVKAVLKDNHRESFLTKNPLIKEENV